MVQQSLAEVEERCVTRRQETGKQQLVLMT
jgi:hypothetical protein